jgi:hypothetical protein
MKKSKIASFSIYFLLFFLFCGPRVFSFAKNTRYLIAQISGSGSIQDFLSLSSIHIPFKGITLQTDDSTSYLFLKWKGVKAEIHILMRIMLN